MQEGMQKTKDLSYTGLSYTGLSCAGLSCIRGDRRLFSGLDFRLGSGDWLQIEGENGAGKTSLLRMVAGLLAAESGVISWHSRPVSENRDAFNADLLYLGHAAAIKDDLTPLENLRINAAIVGQPITTEAAVDALTSIGLLGRASLPCRFLSQGQKRRVALARLLLTPARLWILDEPFVALDAAAVTMLCAIIDRHLNDGGMALLTSHQPIALNRPGASIRLGR